jgi:hypothetical protein
VNRAIRILNAGASFVVISLRQRIDPGSNESNGPVADINKAAESFDIVIL